MNNIHIIYQKPLTSYENITPAYIDIRTIAHSLSMQCRFNGHTPKFYSVAEHSMITYEIAKHLFKKCNNKNSIHLSRLLARKEEPFPCTFLKSVLLHDAEEAYMGDITRPTILYVANVAAKGEKNYIYALKSLIKKVIFKRYHLDVLFSEHYDMIHWIDNTLLDFERNLFFKDEWPISDMYKEDEIKFWQSKIRYLSSEIAKEKFLETFKNV